jgi:dihydrodipicolinate synthase
VVKLFKGVIVPTVTLFDDDRKIDFKANEIQMNRLIESGVNGLFYMGTTGEFMHMNTDERKQIIKWAVEAAGKRVPILVGTGSTNIYETVELTNYAKEVGADAAVVITPYYLRLTQEELYHYYRKIFKHTDIHILIYNYPDLSGNNISPQTVSHLAMEYENLVGIKETIESVSHIRKMILEVKSIRPDFSVLCGYDDHTINTLIMGGDGVIGALANIRPDVFVSLYKAFIAGDWESIREYNSKILKLMKLYDFNPVSMVALKKALEILNITRNPKVRLPHASLTEVEVRDIQSILEDI